MQPKPRLTFQPHVDDPGLGRRKSMLNRAATVGNEAMVRGTVQVPVYGKSSRATVLPLYQFDSP